MLHDRHLYTVHKVPVRFQRCLACMVAKQGPCGDHKATWLCRSRLTDAPPGKDVQNGVHHDPQLCAELDTHVSCSKWPLSRCTVDDSSLIAMSDAVTVVMQLATSDTLLRHQTHGACLLCSSLFEAIPATGLPDDRPP